MARTANTPLEKTLEADILTLQKRGHFYFALTHMSHMLSYVSDRNRRDLRAESASNSASSWFTGLSPKWILPSASDCVKQWAQCRADHSRRVGIAACIPGISQSFEPIHGREEIGFVPIRLPSHDTTERMTF